MLAGCLGVAGWAQSSGDGEFSDLLKQGFQLHQQARFAEAIPVLERARRLEPGDYFANLLLGIDLLRTGKPAEAVPRLQLAARARPGEEFPEDYLGEAEAGLGEYALAAEAYQRAVARGHGSEQALEAWAGFAVERFRAIGADLRASQQGIATARRLQDAAAKPLAAQNCEDPIPLLERRLAVKRAAPDVDTAYKLSICYAVEAGRAAEGLQANDDDVAAVHRVRGDVLLRLKEDAGAAEAEYRQAIAIRPGDPALLERLAEAQLSAGDTEGARQSALAALAIDPHRREAVRTLASLAMNNREYDKALPWLRQLAGEAPGDRTVQVELGKALAGTGEAQESLHWLNAALAAGYPDEKGALHALEGRELRTLGRDAEAAKAEAEARRLSDAYQARATNGAHGSPDEDQ
ncbi:MAG: tetratricopeptide repeat protein [Terracidiphilus sp.]